MNDRKWITLGIAIGGILLLTSVILYAIWEIRLPGGKTLIPLPGSIKTPDQLTTKQPPKTPPPKSITKLTLENAGLLYTIQGKFVTTPRYVNNLLWSDFVIDEDPTNRRIPVIMTAKTGIAHLGRSETPTFSTVRWATVPTETLRSAIAVNAPAQIRFQAVPGENLGNAKTPEYLDQVMKGYWDLPESFVFVPTGVAVVTP